MHTQHTALARSYAIRFLRRTLFISYKVPTSGESPLLLPLPVAFATRATPMELLASHSYIALRAFEVLQSGLEIGRVVSAARDSEDQAYDSFERSCHSTWGRRGLSLDSFNDKAGRATRWSQKGNSKKATLKFIHGAIDRGLVDLTVRYNLGDVVPFNTTDPTEDDGHPAVGVELVAEGTVDADGAV
ncbi:hypothetical protein NMY22_g19226 [Coprinellus aureogranulatus]|nr:hypothetical protein NMY22_g19226 [Coprinellus aureogranulatus]